VIVDSGKKRQDKEEEDPPESLRVRQPECLSDLQDRQFEDGSMAHLYNKVILVISTT
jgi:hypothetical protein